MVSWWPSCSRAEVMLWNLNYSNRNSQSYERTISLADKVCSMSVRGWITAQYKVAVIHVQLSFLQWQNNSQLGYSCAIWFHQGLWHTRCDLSGEWLWLEHYWHYFITKCTWVLRLFAFHCQIYPSHPTALVLFSPSPFCQVLWQHNTQHTGSQG